MKAVLDANVFMRGNSLPDFEILLTVPGVQEELETSDSRLKLDVSGVEVREPSEEYLQKVTEKACEIESPTSGPDERLLALALEEDAVLVTDDLALQNLASRLGVDFSSYMGEEIDGTREWKMVCGNCGREVEEDSCDACGSTDITRKPDQCS